MVYGCPEEFSMYRVGRKSMGWVGASYLLCRYDTLDVDEPPMYNHLFKSQPCPA